MVAISHAVLLGMATSFGALVSAGNCHTGLLYCGSGLLYIGNYYDQIIAALSAATPPQPTDSTHVHDSLFYCAGGDNGDITFQTFCAAGCKDGGSGESDYC
ncbi:hypothetical protein N0V85_009553 [Neurospora sp. IMI 360204]|nr:hypothetical protein N0V85_009553 [Neurospora sp. IMI 360204]